MPEFINPFPGMGDREMTPTELARAIMIDIAAELEAVHLYLAHMDATTNADAKKVLYDIALEELVHAGEFTNLLYRLDPTVAAKAQEGFAEVNELLGSNAPYGITANDESSAPITEEVTALPATGQLTVGSLKES
jgi:rubrerythrin